MCESPIWLFCSCLNQAQMPLYRQVGFKLLLFAKQDCITANFMGQIWIK